MFVNPALLPEWDGQELTGFPVTGFEEQLAVFCAGWQSTITRNPRKKSDFKLLKDVDEIWAFACRKPGNGWRIFGRFVDKDLFVSLTAHSRNDLADFENYTALAKAAGELWDKLLPDCTPLRAASNAAYMTNAWDFDEG
ncbi:MAG: hypothetical protein AAFW97_13295 [Pseudomonadota bacterium]